MKGNNPLTLYHFPRLGLYVYASTEAILKKGVKKGLVRAERPVEVELNEGEILRIDRQGRRKVETFNTENLYDSRFLFGWPKLSCGGGDDGYVRELKSFAGAYGFTAKDVDTFLSYGMYPEEIEEIMCCGEV